jgi:hypothetical protein
MLVLSGALAEMAWPVILSKRESFRYGARFLKIFDSSQKERPQINALHSAGKCSWISTPCWWQS